jgi:cell division transport system permease protein
MFQMLNPPLGERRLLPDRRGRPTPWVIAIMMFVTLVVGAAGLAVANSARLVSESVASRYSIQIPNGAGQAAAAVAAARRAPGVTAVEQIPDKEVRETLERWLGADAVSADLPVPVLIDVDLAPGADSRALEQYLGRAVPDARLLAYGDRLSPVTRSLRALQWLALGLVLLMIMAMGASVVLATRGAFDTHRSTIEVMHGIGATDHQLARLFQRRIAYDALTGGLVGAGAAMLILLVIIGVPGRLLGDLAGGPILGIIDWLILALFPLVVTLMAMLVARSTVLRALRAAL